MFILIKDKTDLKNSDSAMEEKKMSGAETLRAVLEGKMEDNKPVIKSEPPEDNEVDVTSIPAENEVVVKTENCTDNEDKKGMVGVKLEAEEVNMEVCNEVEIGTTEEEVKTDEKASNCLDAVSSRYLALIFNYYIK